MAMRKTRKAQAGFAVTVELLLLSTILVIGLVTGFAKLRDTTLAELSDTANAVGSINQSFSYLGTTWTDGSDNVATVAGTTFNDNVDNAATNSVGGDQVDIEYDTAASSGVEVP